MTATPTPRTDAIVNSNGLQPREMSAFARQLERDLAARDATIVEYKTALRRLMISHARLENDRGSVVGTLTADARALLARVQPDDPTQQARTARRED